MSQLEYNDITTGKIIVFNDEPCRVLSHYVFRVQKRKPVNQTKLKGLRSGKFYEHSFHQSESVHEAELEKKPLVYIFENKGEYMFHEVGNPGLRFPISADCIGDAVKFLKQRGEYEALVFNNEIIGLSIPIKMQLKVTEAASAVRGNTAQGATKTVVVETGATVTTPLFVNLGDVIEVNTETGEYSGRVEKA